MRPAPLLASFDRRRTARRPRMVLVSRQRVILARLSFLPLIAWAGATLWYFESRGDISLKLLEHQAAIKRSYEEKLGDLRNRLEQMSGQQVADQETLEARLDTLLARQAAFESRRMVFQALTDQVAGDAPDPHATGSVDISGMATGVSAYVPVPPTKLPDIFRLRLRIPDLAPPDRTSDVKLLDRKLTRAAQNLDTLEADQLRSLAAVRRSIDGQVAQLHMAIRKIGLNPDAMDAGGQAGTGGPFVQSEDGPFGMLAAQAQAGVMRLNRLRRSAASLPFAEPVRGEIELSSPYGYRLDPFTRIPAMHTGLDFKAEYGSVVRATGAGRVTAAEYSGAYGNMVEIEHGHGITSRYAHLSSFEVSVGQNVKAGTVLGRVGSTGRSTGPHLHYETRLNGDALDPQRFLKAGALIHPMAVSR